MIIDRTHTRWIFASALILLASAVFYVPYSYRLNGPEGDSWPGLSYGIIGLFFILIAGGLQLRKKVRTWRIGKAQTWMRAHIWLGLLSFPMILFHAGFDFGPPGSLAWIMMWLFVIIILSGIFGLVLQHVLPRMLLNRVGRETVYEQIPNVREQLRWEADWLVSGVAGALPEESLDQVKLKEMREDEAAEKEHMKAVAEAKKNKTEPPPAPHKKAANPAQNSAWVGTHGIRDPKDRKEPPKKEDGSEPILDFYVNEVQGYLVLGQHPTLSNELKAAAAFARVRNLTPQPLHDAINDLEILVTENRQLLAQQRLHFWLHYWLLIHGPISWAMIVMSLVHAVAALYY